MWSKWKWRIAKSGHTEQDREKMFLHSVDNFISGSYLTWIRSFVALFVHLSFMLTYLCCNGRRWAFCLSSNSFAIYSLVSYICVPTLDALVYLFVRVFTRQISDVSLLSSFQPARMWNWNQICLFFKIMESKKLLNCDTIDPAILKIRFVLFRCRES